MLSTIILADMSGIWFLLIFGAIAAVIFFVVTVLLESIALKLLKWNTYWRSLGASLLMNLASLLIGIPLTLLLINAKPIIYFPIAWALSVVIEGGILSLMNRGGGRQNWIAAVVVNIASYLLLAGPLFALTQL